MIELAIAIGIVIGLVEVFKQLGLSSRFAPLLAIVLGILAMGVEEVIGVQITNVIVQGLIVGLSACGLWDVGKKSILGK